MGREAQGLGTRNTRHKVVPRTLCFLTRGEKLLLLRGSPNKRLWPNLLNGVGGHVERDEDVRTAAIREVQEETGLHVTELRLVAVIQIDAGEPEVGVLVFVFRGSAPDEPIVASGEGTLEWVPLAALPFDEMVEDLHLLLPRIMALDPVDPPIFGFYAYDSNNHLVARFSGESAPNASIGAGDNT